MPMSYPWYVGGGGGGSGGAGAPNNGTTGLAGGESVPQNGSLTHSPANLAGSDSPGTSTHPVAPASGGFPSTSPYPALSATTSQHSSESQSQSPHGLPPPSAANPPSFPLSGFGESSLSQHIYPTTSRFGPFNTDGVPSAAEQSFSSTFGMTPQMLSQSYSMRSQPYAGYRDPSQQDMAQRLSAYSASPYAAAPGFESYYPSQSAMADSMLSDRMIKDPFENGMARAGANPWFGADSRDGLYLQTGYPPHPMSPYGSPLGSMFQSRYRPMGYDGTPFPRPDLADPYGLAGSSMMSSYMERKDKKKEMSPGLHHHHHHVNPNDSPPVPNKASRYFSNRGIFTFRPPDAPAGISPYSTMMLSMADRYILCQKMLCQRLADVDLPPKVTYVYNPLEYAFDTHYKFVKKYYNTPKRILFLGMNPGPFGMSQNGVPFGECNIVTDWMEIDGEVLKPVLEHPKRPVMGMECKRSEVSGARFWELFRRLCPTADSFFKNCAIHNLCPLAFMTDTGKNVAPSDMPVKVLRQLDSLCDQTFLDVVALFKVEHVITVGKYAFTCAQKAMTTHGMHGVQLHCMMHPSPANPSANKGWTDIAENQLREFGVYTIIAVNPQPPKNPPPPPSPKPEPPPPAEQQQPQQQQQQQQQHQTPPHHPQQQHQHPASSSQESSSSSSQEAQISAVAAAAHLPPAPHHAHQPPTSLHPSYSQMMAAHYSHQAAAQPLMSHPGSVAGPDPVGYPGNPYLAHPSAYAPHHMGHHPHHHHPNHSAHHAYPQSPYAMPHMLQSTAAGINPLAPLPHAMGGGGMGMGVGGHGGEMMLGKRTCDVVADGNPIQKHMRLEET